MKYGEELKAEVLKTKARMQEALDRRDERIANWETDEDDCFLSIRVEQNAISECNMQLKILDTDGTEEFEAVFDENGSEVRVRNVNTKYGWKVVGNGVWANSRKALLKKTGWTTRKIRVPVWTKFVPSGSGMMGVYGGSYEVVRWHTNMVTGEYVGYPD